MISSRVPENFPKKPINMEESKFRESSSKKNNSPPSNDQLLRSFRSETMRYDNCFRFSQLEKMKFFIYYFNLN